MALYEVYVVSRASTGSRSRCLSTNSFAKAKEHYLSTVADAALCGSEALLVMRCSGRTINLFDFALPAEKIIVRPF